MRRKRFSLLRLFSNNKAAFVFSAFTAVIIWVLVAIFFSPVEQRVIDNVPVVIDLNKSIPEKLGLQVFGQSEFKVSVTVSGKRYVISPTALSAEDIIVSANTNYVDSAGKNRLQLELSPKDPGADFEITGCSEKNVEVFFDHFLEKEYPVIPDISSANGAILEGFIQGDTVLSSDLVTVSGPATEVEKIKSVIAKVKIESPLQKTTTFDSTAIPINEYGGTLRYLTVNDGFDVITVTLPVLKAAVLKTSVLFKNTPSYFADKPIISSCSPENLNVAMSAELLENASVISVGSIDFSQIDTGLNKFAFKSGSLANAKVLDDTEEIAVSFEISGFEKKILTVPVSNVVFKNADEGISVEVVGKEGINVTVIGLPEEIDKLTGNDISASIDAAQLGAEKGVRKAPADITISNTKSCWAYGSFTVDVKLS
jgi:hypothetical protein